MPEQNKYISIINNLRNVWRSHIQWVRGAIMSILYELDDAEYEISRLPRLPQMLGNILRPYYGNETADYIETIFIEHNKFLINLIHAIKKGDTREAQENRIKWYQFTTFLGHYLEGINANWDSDTIDELFFEYYKLIEVILVKRFNKDYEEVNHLYDELEKLALKIADYIGIGLMKQFGIIHNVKKMNARFF